MVLISVFAKRFVLFRLILNLGKKKSSNTYQVKPVACSLFCRNLLTELNICANLVVNDSVVFLLCRSLRIVCPSYRPLSTYTCIYMSSAIEVSVIPVSNRGVELFVLLIIKRRVCDHFRISYLNLEITFHGSLNLTVIIAWLKDDSAGMRRVLLLSHSTDWLAASQRPHTHRAL